MKLDLCVIDLYFAVISDHIPKFANDSFTLKSMLFMFHLIWFQVLCPASFNNFIGCSVSEYFGNV